MPLYIISRSSLSILILYSLFPLFLNELSIPNGLSLYLLLYSVHMHTISTYLETTMRLSSHCSTPSLVSLQKSPLTVFSSSSKPSGLNQSRCVTLFRSVTVQSKQPLTKYEKIVPTNMATLPSSTTKIKDGNKLSLELASSNKTVNLDYTEAKST